MAEESHAPNQSWWNKLLNAQLVYQSLDVLSLVPRGPFCHALEKSGPLARSNDIPVLNGCVNTIDWDQNQSDSSNLTLRRVTGGPWIADFRSWTWPEVAIPVANQKNRGLWERDCTLPLSYGYNSDKCKLHCTRARTVRVFFDGVTGRGQLSKNQALFKMARPKTRLLRSTATGLHSKSIRFGLFGHRVEWIWSTTDQLLSGIATRSSVQDRNSSDIFVKFPKIILRGLGKDYPDKTVSHKKNLFNHWAGLLLRRSWRNKIAIQSISQF